MDLLARAEDALAAQASARAIALFGRYLVTQQAGSQDVGRAYLGLARAHEQLRDCAAAVRAYDEWLDRFGDAVDAAGVLARRGACEAELGQWERSAASFRRVAGRPDLLPSVQVEALAREGLALFHLERFEEADRALARADEIYERAREDDSERFGDYYFVGMARFYRAAILHLAFREVALELPEQVMEEALQRKLELLGRAQEAYNHTIAAKHMFWVSAAGYQLGHMLGEFYDAVMGAPVPTWLDDRQRGIYYEELKKQLRPVIDKAVWVFDKSLETARRLGYESPFVERTQAKLGHLQAVLISDEATFGRPNPALVRESADAVAPPAAEAAGDAASPAAERKLFVPRPTPL
jgi:tetratricopeptide (TPR) repeat protein